MVCRLIIFPRFAFSIHLGSPTPTIFRKTNYKGRALQPKSRATSIPPPPSSSLPMAPSPASLSVSTMPSPLYPPSSLEPDPRMLPSYLPTPPTRSSEIFLRTLSQIVSKTPLSSFSTTPLRSRGGISSSRMARLRWAKSTFFAR